MNNNNKLNASKCEIVTAAYNANDYSEFEILAGFQTETIDYSDRRLSQTGDLTRFLMKNAVN